MTTGRDNYTRLYELLTLIDLLRNSTRGITYDDIREKFGWGRKTAERVLNLLENHFAHSFVRDYGEDDKKAYFRLRGEDRFPPNYITENEIVALRTSLGFVSTNEPLKLQLESLAGKLEALKKDGVSNIEDLTIVNGTAFAPRPRIQNDRKIIEMLQEAILAFHSVKIDYKQSNHVVTPLVVCPLGLLYSVQDNYLVAAHEGEVDRRLRHYKLSHVLSAEVTDGHFNAKGFDIHKYAAKSFGVWISPDGGYKVKWRVKPEAAERAKRFVFHPTQKFTEQEDGSLIVELFADGLREMAWHLMTWEGGIQPIAPKELVTEYENQLKLAAEALE